TLRDEPGDDVRDLLRPQRRRGAVEPPVRHAKIGASRDDRRSEVLVAHEREIRRIGDAAPFWSAASVLSVAPGARRSKDGATTVDVSGVVAGLRPLRVGRKVVSRDHLWSLPALLYSLHQDADLLIRQRTTGALCERRLRSPRDAGRDQLTHPFGRDHAEIDGIVQRTRRAEAPGLAVTPGAIPRVERCKRHDLSRRDLASVGSWPAG